MPIPMPPLLPNAASQYYVLAMYNDIAIQAAKDIYQNRANTLGSNHYLDLKSQGLSR